MKARVWVKQDRLTEALSWVRERGLPVNDDLSYMREFEHVTLVRILLAQYRNDRIDDTIHQAVQLLELLLKKADRVVGREVGSKSWCYRRSH